MATPLKVLGFAGSLRQASYNKAILRACVDLAPEGMAITIFDIGEIPVFNQDHEDPLPPSVKAFKAAIEAADALLIVTPEYNHGLPGCLKNALDWGTRPSGSNSFNKKPAAVTGATPGRGGTVYSQMQLRHFLQTVNAYCLPMPEVLIGQVNTKLDESGTLTDEETKKYLGRLLTGLQEWAGRFGG